MTHQLAGRHARRILAVALAAPLAFSLAACSPGGAPVVATGSALPGASSPGQGEDPGPQETADVTTVEQTGVNEPPALKEGATSVILDAKMTRCDAGPGSVVSAGTVTNRQDGPRDIVVTASWGTSDGAKTFARASAVIRQLAPGKSAAFEIKSTVQAPAGTMVLCSFNPQSGTLK